MLTHPEHQDDGDISDPLLSPLPEYQNHKVGFRSWLSSIHFSRWQSFAGICFYVSVVGTTYAFGVYSNLLKSNLGFSQNGIDIIASVGNTGLYLSLLGGVLLDRFGLHFVVYLGGFLIFIGFFYIWLAIEGYVPADILSVSIFFLLSQFGVCCHISSAVTCAVRLFPKEVRGSAVGLAKGYFGLSSAVLSDFSGGYFSNSKEYFILFIAISIPIIGCIGVSFANFLPQHAIGFEFDRSRGVNTSLVPFFIHWSILFLVLFTVGFIQYAYDDIGRSSLIAPTILAVTVLSILIIPTLYGARIINDENWYNTGISSRNLTDLEKNEKKKSIENKNKKENDEDNLTFFISKDYENNKRNDYHSYMNNDKMIHSNDGDGDRTGVYFGETGFSKLINSAESTDDDVDDKVFAEELPKNYQIKEEKSDLAKLNNRNFNGNLNINIHKLDIIEQKELQTSSQNNQKAYVAVGKYGYGSLDYPKLENYTSLADQKYKIDNKNESENINGNVDENEDENGNEESETIECYYGASVPLSVSVRTWRFWSLYISFLIICGTGLMVIDNINVISEAVSRYPNDYFVTLLSLANGAGRVSSGFASDALSKYYSKLQLLSMIAILMGVSHIIFAIGSTDLLYLSLLFVGYLFGCTVSLLAVIVADLFGPKFIPTNFGAIDSAPIFGSYIFVTGIISIFYETNTINDMGEKSCVGANCFRTPFLINSFCCFSVAILLYYMHLSTHMYEFENNSKNCRIVL